MYVISYAQHMLVLGDKSCLCISQYADKSHEKGLRKNIYLLLKKFTELCCLYVKQTYFLKILPLFLTINRLPVMQVISGYKPNKYTICYELRMIHINPSLSSPLK